MKNIISKLKLVTIAVLTLSVTSCDAILDDEVTDYGTGPEFVGFQNSTVTAPIEVTGEPSTYNVRVRYFGPAMPDETRDVTVTVAVDEANSTAVEGEHYSLTTNTVTLTAENNYVGNIPVTVYTEGIEPPTEETLVLVVTGFTTDIQDEIVVSDTGERVNVTISYICYADLSGTYTLTNSVCNAEVTDVTITRNDEGGWDLSTADGGLLQYCTSNTGLQNYGSLIEVCGEIRPSNDVAFCGSNGIGCITGGSWDQETGILTLQHNDTFFGVGDYTSTYVRTSGGPDSGGSNGEETDEDETETEE